MCILVMQGILLLIDPVFNFGVRDPQAYRNEATSGYAMTPFFTSERYINHLSSL